MNIFCDIYYSNPSIFDKAYNEYCWIKQELYSWINVTLNVTVTASKCSTDCNVNCYNYDKSGGNK